MTEKTLTLRLHSVMLGVSDIERALDFYVRTLDLTLVSRFGDFAMLETGGTTIVLSAQLRRARPASGSAPVEIVFAVDSVREAYDRLVELGVKFLNAPHTIDGTNDVANFEDADGHLLSLYGLP
jgi:catechol 2,3-dioxygenase-like lactoylglutathione lyase family enzyme